MMKIVKWKSPLRLFSAIRSIVIATLIVVPVLPVHAMVASVLRKTLIDIGKRALTSKNLPALSSVMPNMRAIQIPVNPSLAISDYQSKVVDLRNFLAKEYTRQDRHRFYREQAQPGDGSSRDRQRRYKLFFVGSMAAAAACPAAAKDELACSADEYAVVSEDVSSRVDEGLSDIPGNFQASAIELNYTINLMWINRKFEQNQKYIHPSKTQQELEANLLGFAFQWAATNPKAIVYIWYDSAFLTQEAIHNTQDVVDGYAHAHPGIAPIELKDVCDLPFVQNNIEIFSDKLPVYFRVDLLRLIVSLHLLSQSNQPAYLVYADADVEPIAQEELLDKDTLENLKKYGIVVAEDETWGFGFENGFHILSNQKPNLVYAIQRTLIELNTLRAQNALQGKFKHMYRPEVSPVSGITQVVYHSYPLMLLYFFQLEGLGKLFIDEQANYDYHNHGLEPLGTETFDMRMCKGWVVEDSEEEERQKTIDYFAWHGPTKKISTPPAKGEYDFALPDSELSNISGEKIQEQIKQVALLTAGAACVVVCAWSVYQAGFR